MTRGLGNHTSHRAGGRRPSLVRSSVVRGVTAVLLILGVALPATLADPSTAAADTQPPAGLPSTVSSDPLATAQIDGVAWTQLVVGNTVFVGGRFTKARPAGAAPGTQTVDRTYLMSYDLTTGALTGFAPTLNAEVKALAASPDGATLFVAGAFTTVNGATRNRMAAFTIATGALVTGFAPSLNYIAYGVAATNSTVYIGGGFTTVNGTARKRVAAVDRFTGATRPLVTDVVDNLVRQVALSPDQTKVVIGGNFSAVNGTTTPGYGYGLAMLDATSGAPLPLPVNSLIRDARTNGAIYSLASTADGFYGSGYAFDKADGNLEGTFKADWDGNLTWVEDCHGDTYSIFPSGDEVYVAGHPHYCGNVGGFPQTDPWTYNRGLAFTQNATGVVGRDPYGYFNYEGKPRPTLLHWFPDLNSGTFTGQNQGPWTVAGNASYIVYGGEFTQVNGKAQQGLVRFARNQPKKDGPRLSGAGFVPTVQSFDAGLRIVWPANYDRDNERLTYQLIKGGDLSNPIFSTDARSTFWRQPLVSFLDTDVSPGQSYNYRLRATDPDGNSVLGDSVTAIPTGGPALSTYDKAALKDGPTSYWPLNETSGTVATDVAGTSNATRSGGVTMNVPGAITGDPGRAYRFPGNSTGYLATTGTSKTGPQDFSVAAWVKTSSTSGGKIIGFGSSATGNSGTTDRHLYLGNSGRIYFGVNPGNRILTSPGSYNNGQWHHVVGTLSPAGLYLYVDGQLVGSRTDTISAQIYKGFWRVGGDSLTNWAGAGSSAYLAGDIDDPAVYPVALTAQQVQAQYAAGTGVVTNLPPTARFTSTSADLTAAFDGSTSTDPDGTISQYAWNFGDSQTATGATSSHTYTSAGTYPVTLTVTDDDGDTDSKTTNVTVTAPPGGPFAADGFNRTSAAGWGSAETGGAWSVSSTGNTSVGAGAGLLRLPSPGATTSAYLGTVQQDSSDVRLDFTADKPATGGGTFLSLEGRRVAAKNAYRATVRLSNANKVVVTLEAQKNSPTATTLAPSVTLPENVTAGTQIHVRLQTFGAGSTTTIRAKVWTGSATEPAGWTTTATDAEPGLQGLGGIGLICYLSGSATNAPVGLSILEIAATPVP